MGGEVDVFGDLVFKILYWIEGEEWSDDGTTEEGIEEGDDGGLGVDGCRNKFATIILNPARDH